MTINVDLLLEIREQITSHPETHSQKTWGFTTECGTTHCIAGWAAALTRARLTWSRDFGGQFLNGANGEDPEDYAAKALGLGEGDAYWLFYAPDSEALRVLDALIEKGKNA